jgi:hypothetical protein
LSFLFCWTIGTPSAAEEIVRQQSEEAPVETAEEATTSETVTEEQPAEEENIKDAWDESSEEEEADGRF